jgi:hypothetical protein
MYVSPIATANASSAAPLFGEATKAAIATMRRP